MTNNGNSTQKKHYFNVAQLRADLWAELKLQSYRLARYKEPKKIEAHKTTALKSVKTLRALEQYWAFPGLELLDYLQSLLKKGDYVNLKSHVVEINRILVSQDYRHEYVSSSSITQVIDGSKTKNAEGLKKRYFEVLFVENLTVDESRIIKNKLLELRDDKDHFIYRIVLAQSFQDALVSLQLNPNIQAIIVRYGIPFKSRNVHGVLKQFVSRVSQWGNEDCTAGELAILLGKVIGEIRPELDAYYVTDTAVQDISDSVLQNFRRIFYRTEDLQELHLSIIRGIKERYETPFYTALQEYSQKPTGVFHAMPVSRGNSVFKSNWIDDFGEFYGRNLFLAETSSTTGGLDSLLQPTGPLKKAQKMAAKAFGSKYTFFATNGTSTSNKIVLQALVQPEDIVLIDRDCHKSHHYGMVLSGAYAVYLDSYPVEQYSMYGAVPLAVIKDKLLELKQAGKLDRVKMLLLTNCTFDGLVYNVEKVMEEVLAIKPDMIFLWDEAWFGFAAFTPTFRQRTAMYVAQKLSKKYQSESYRKTYQKHLKEITKAGAKQRLPDPEKVKIRVYATQSTHKTLSSFRQGSMIHIFDQEFKRKVEETFHEAYMTHTSTSANYQILGSLDVGRRQVVFEGFELVEKSIEMAMTLRARINDHPQLKKYFKVLTLQDLIPQQYRLSGMSEYYDSDKGWNRLEQAWEEDEFVLDPTKINLFIGNTGVDGDTFKNKYLMDQFNIQVNKTSRNTVLFMTNIGTTRSSVSFLLGVLLKISNQLDLELSALNPTEHELRQQQIFSLTEDTPPLPDFSHFHETFRAFPGLPGGKIRWAFFLSYTETNCEYIKLTDCANVMEGGRQIVSASFVIPYPPGFPVLVPGQVMTAEILDFLIALDVKEIHGYRPELGLRVFKQSALKVPAKEPAAAMSNTPKKDLKPSPKKRISVG